MKISFARPALPGTGTLVVGFTTRRAPTGLLAAVDDSTRGFVLRTAADAGFDGKRGETLDLVLPADAGADRLVLVGLGEPSELDPLACRKLGGVAVASLEATGTREAVFAVDPLDGSSLRSAEIAAEIAYGARLRAYRFDRYRTRARPDDRPAVLSLLVQVADLPGAEEAFRPLSAVADGVFLARDLVNEPANVLTPKAFVERVRSLDALGLEVQALDQAELERIGAGALLAVGRGSAVPPQLLVLSWRGASDPKAAPVALVGKGITFDTGGISVKPAKGMWDMRGDMAGAAAVIGTMASLAGRRARVNAVGVVALAENMLSGSAFRPGDVVRSLSGRTIEVIDTDAEGRLVLADALAYAVDRFRPRAVVDIATLTGSIVRALGSGFAGLFSGDDALAAALIEAGEAEEERLWRMPLDPHYVPNLESDIADLRQVAPDEESADAIHGATLLRHFVDDVPWAHIDTGMQTQARKDQPLCPKGATGFAVRLLERWIARTMEG